MNCEFKRKLPIPKEVKEMYPVTAKMQEDFTARDIEIKKVLSGKSDKLLMIIGP